MIQQLVFVALLVRKLHVTLFLLTFCSIIMLYMYIQLFFLRYNSFDVKATLYFT